MSNPETCPEHLCPGFEYFLIRENDNKIIENPLPPCSQNDYTLPVDIYEHMEQYQGTKFDKGTIFNLDTEDVIEKILSTHSFTATSAAYSALFSKISGFFSNLVNNFRELA